MTEMWYVTRDAGTQEITGLFARPRAAEDSDTGVATETTPLAEDHPDVVAFLAQQNTAPTVYIPKLVIVERLEAAGLRAAAKTALAADDYQQDRWNAATAIDPNDQAVRQLLTSVGADLDVILAVD